MRLTFTACAMASAIGAASLATSAQAVPLPSAIPAVAASTVDSGFTKVAMSEEHMMMMKKKHMKKKHMMMKKHHMMRRHHHHMDHMDDHHAM